MELIALWIYLALLIAGGLTGYLKAGSKASLIASVAFAIPLLLVAVGILPGWIADVVLVVLLIFFGKRYATTKSFMPGGLMSIASALLLILRWVL